jgi:hypothetical protein
VSNQLAYQANLIRIDDLLRQAAQQRQGNEAARARGVASPRVAASDRAHTACNRAGCRPARGSGGEVELVGLEPTASCMPCKRSPS